MLSANAALLQGRGLGRRDIQNPSRADAHGLRGAQSWAVISAPRSLPTLFPLSAVRGSLLREGRSQPPSGLRAQTAGQFTPAAGRGFRLTVPRRGLTPIGQRPDRAEAPPVLGKTHDGTPRCCTQGGEQVLLGPSRFADTRYCTETLNRWDCLRH